MTKYIINSIAYLKQNIQAQLNHFYVVNNKCLLKAS